MEMLNVGMSQYIFVFNINKTHNITIVYIFNIVQILCILIFYLSFNNNT